MKTIILSFVSLFLSVNAFAHPGHQDHGMGHLAFQNGSLHAHLTWDVAPTGDRSESKMHLEWRDGATHELVNPPGDFAVSLWMPSMGHGSRPTTIVPIAMGTYQITNMFFLMPGDWEVRVTLKSANGEEETQKWSVMVEGDHHHAH